MTHHKIAIFAAVLIVLPIGFAGGDVTSSCAGFAWSSRPCNSAVFLPAHSDFSACSQCNPVCSHSHDELRAHEDLHK